MLLLSKIEYFNHVKNKTDKSRHLACIQLENLKDVAYGCHDVAIILRQPKFKKSYRVSIPPMMSA